MLCLPSQWGSGCWNQAAQKSKACGVGSMWAWAVPLHRLHIALCCSRGPRESRASYKSPWQKCDLQGRLLLTHSFPTHFPTLGSFLGSVPVLGRLLSTFMASFLSALCGSCHFPGESQSDLLDDPLEVLVALVFTCYFVSFPWERHGTIWF